MKQPEIGKTVTSLRLQKGMTQEKLAELCEVSARTIQRIESGSGEKLPVYIVYSLSEMTGSYSSR